MIKKKIKDLSIEKKLAFTALILGFLALFTGSPYNNHSFELNAKDYLYKVDASGSKVDPLELADWIIQGKSDFTIVDLRTEEEFTKYYIPTSQNIPTASLLESGLLRNEKIILYGSDEVETAQASMILKSRDYKGVYILDGGIDSWKEKVLFPSVPADGSKEAIEEYRKIVEVSKYFGGTPQTSGEGKKAEIKMPVIKMPAATVLKRAGKRKKREGC